MSFYSDEYIEKVKNEFESFQLDKSRYAEIANLTAIIASGYDMQSQLYCFAYYGILRRIKILEDCVENIFNIRNFFNEKIPSEKELSDITINLQSFIINLYGLLENLAWVFAICVNFKGSKFDISFFAQKQKLLNQLPENIKNDFIKDVAWFKHIKCVRDLLAHQEPFYIPPYCVIEDKQNEWLLLEQKKKNIENNYLKKIYKDFLSRQATSQTKVIFEPISELQQQQELETQRNEEISKINEEQQQYLIFRPILVTNTNKKDLISIEFYPQVLIDMKTVYEKVYLLLKYIVDLNRQL